MNPRSGGFGDGDDFVEWIKSSDIQFTGIKNHDGWTHARRENRLKDRNIDLAVRPGWNGDDAAVPQA